METFNSLINKYYIVIPKLQRDYAQGREGVSKIRNNFLDKIEAYLFDETDDRLHLDFIYGYTNKDIFVPLDGQQRLTTLFLLFWYASRTGNVGIEADNLVNKLSKFSYETRLSSERFCNKLVNFNINRVGVKSISNHIKNQHWFVRNWENDPTVKAMLVMLDSIHNKFAKRDNLLDRLFEKQITFKLIDIKSDNFKLTDELYIKMNSRGRPLTDFENFKAEFSEILRSDRTDYFNHPKVYRYKDESKKVSYQQYFSFKIDTEWTDLFWNHPKRKDYKIDGLLYNYFDAITEVLFNIQYGDKSDNNDDSNYELSIDVLKQIYSHKKNVDILFASLDFHSSLEDVEGFYNQIFTTEYSLNKIRLFEEKEVDLLGKIIDGNISVFEQILFYSLCVYKKEIDHSNIHDISQFLRIIRNVLINERQIDAKNRIGIISDLRINRMFYYNKFIEGFLNNIKSTNSLIDAINSEYDVQYLNKNISLEKEKLHFINSEENYKYLIGLENHQYLKGNLETLALNDNNIKDFYDIINLFWPEGKLTKEENTLICQALLSLGDYSVISHGYSSLGTVKYFGVNNYWQRILAPINDKEKAKTKGILKDVCENYKLSTEKEKFFRNIIADKLRKYDEKIVEKDWIYYFLTYGEILSSDFNLFTWSEKGFDINIVGSTSRQPLSSYHYNPYLKLIANNLNINEIKFHYERYSETSYINIDDKLYVYFEEYGLQIGVYEGFDFDFSKIKTVEGHINENQRLEVIIDSSLDRIEISKIILTNLFNEIN